MNEEIKNKTRIKLVGVGGSLPEGSFNQALLEAGVIPEEAMHVCPAEGKLEILEGIGDFALYSQDLEANMPDVVKAFKNKNKQADAILIATPEYDYSIPGYLKNAIDWASRPYGDNSFDNIPGGHNECISWEVYEPNMHFGKYVFF